MRVRLSQGLSLALFSAAFQAIATAKNVLALFLLFIVARLGLYDVQLINNYVDAVYCTTRVVIPVDRRRPSCLFCSLHFSEATLFSDDGGRNGNNVT